METVSSVYLEGMGNMVRRPSRMRLTFHYPTGDVVYNNADIVKVSEKKTAHLIAGELPAIELEIELKNISGIFNPNSMSGLHDMLIKGVLVNYEFGYDIPKTGYYGYTEGTTEHDYGMEENVPYGFIEGYATEWIPGGEVFTSGEISYSKTTATITAKDYLSFLDEKVLLPYANRTLAQVAKDILSLTSYPKEVDGDPKIVTGPELDAFNTTITLSETEEDAISAKEHLQTIAHACGVQMYIDRSGYIHLDSEKRDLSSVYNLPLNQQGEEPEHRKEQMPKKVSVILNSEYGDPLEVELDGGGEAMTVENPFIVTDAEGTALLDIVSKEFLDYRNTADIPYRGEPALDVLDTITLGTDFGGDVTAIIVGTDLLFDGTLSGSLSVRYQLGANTPEKVQITGNGNFIYPLGAILPLNTSYTLTCSTDVSTPTYQWGYYILSTGVWQDITGATSNTLVIPCDDPMFDNDDMIKIRCVVNGVRAAMVQIKQIHIIQSPLASYRGVVEADAPNLINISNPVTGDVVLLDNTDNPLAETYGPTCVYDGTAWVVTSNSDALGMTYADALNLNLENPEKDVGNLTDRLNEENKIRPYVELEADVEIFNVSVRNVYDTEEITFTATILNFVPDTIQWYRSDGGTFIDVNNVQKKINTSTIIPNEIAVTVVATYQGTSYTGRVFITKNVSTEKVIHYFGGITTETPKDLYGADLIDGDYFLVLEDFTEDDYTYKTGTLWEYASGGWVISEDKTKALNAMGDFATIAEEADDATFCKVLAKEVYAQTAVIEEIFSKNITVTEDGSIGSEDFTEDEDGTPTSGFMIDNPITPTGRRGRIRSHGGIFNNAMVYGNLVHDAIETREETGDTPVSTASPTGWNRKDFWDALSVTENSADMIATNLNIAGTAYSYLRKITSATFEKQIVAYARYNATNADSSEYYTSYGKGNIRVNAVTVLVTDGAHYVGTRIEIYVDGVKVANLTNPSAGQTTHEVILAVNKSSTIRVRRLAGANFSYSETPWSEYGIDWRSPKNCIHISNETTSWDTIEDMDTSYLTRQSWTCTTPITFDSATVTKYILGNSFVEAFNNLPIGLTFEVDDTTSSITSGGVTKAVLSMAYFESYVRLDLEDFTTVQVSAGENKDQFYRIWPLPPLRTLPIGWSSMSATVSLISKEAIITSNIIPKNTTREIGEFDNPFKKIWVDDIVAESIDMGEGPIVVDQNLRSSDSPTFAGMTLKGWDLKRVSYKYQPPVQGTVTIDAMEVGEMRVCTFGPLGTTSGDNIEDVKLPSGGTYICMGRYSNDYDTYYLGAEADSNRVYGPGFLLASGGTIIATDEGSSQLDIYNAYFIIWRVA